MLDHLATVNPSGNLDLYEPPRENTKLALLADPLSLLGYIPQIIFTHDGRIFANSNLYHGESPVFTPDDLSEHAVRAASAIPDEFRKNFGYLDTLL